MGKNISKKNESKLLAYLAKMNAEKKPTDTNKKEKKK
jgi:hypothetical protein